MFQDFCEFQNILYTLKLQGLATPSQDLRKKKERKKNVVMDHYLCCNKYATSTFSLQKSVSLDLASRALIKFLDFYFQWTKQGVYRGRGANQRGNCRPNCKPEYYFVLVLNNNETFSRNCSQVNTVGARIAGGGAYLFNGVEERRVATVIS